MGSAIPSLGPTTEVQIIKTGWGSNKIADLVGAAIINRLKPVKTKVKTLTYDNSKEFCAHAKVNQALGSTGYFAQLFASWQSGFNENFNGLLRQYIQEKLHMENVSDEVI